MKTLKYLLLLGAVIIFTDVFAIKVVRKGKGPNGYDYVSQGSTIFGEDKLVCKNPGRVTCGWVSGPAMVQGNSGLIDVHDIMNYVQNQVDIGNTSGQTIYDGITVIWIDISDENGDGHELTIDAEFVE